MKTSISLISSIKYTKKLGVFGSLFLNFSVFASCEAEALRLFRLAAEELPQ
ncbi:MAG: hypothetical protein Sv326_0510 [Candidatus Fermentimicrarchaeum limneticum]|uniref:Uncharacterized protein n=1 Tax=Fermentimicrarchaeum limneticum TaxID=2795018 RepID=A0A7D5XC30_FERL1|nr:MAG: hypothetical protein Sv326_0510 [Candidatus Fermentimicrarchaeum limneticum]